MRSPSAGANLAGPGDQRIGRVGDLGVLRRGRVDGRRQHRSDRAGILRVSADVQTGRQHGLAILTASHGDTVTLIVESSGPPVTTEQAASLFEPFRRLHADRVGSARGSGLGLSIVRAVARAHAGEATAAPVAGGGLRVTVTLPAARPALAGP